MKIKKLIHPRTTALIISIFGGLIMLLVARPVLAGPSQCAVNTGSATVGPQDCSKAVTGVPDNTRAYLAAAAFDDKCYSITVKPGGAPDVKEANCTVDEPFKSAANASIDRNTKEFSQCSGAKDNNQDPVQGCVSTYINTAINVLSAAVIVIVIIMVIIGGIRYSAAGGDAQKVQGAKQQIYNALLAFGAYIFLFVFLQWAVPGGWF